MLLLTNGTIATMDPARPMAEAAVVDGAYFAYVGGRADAEDFARRFSRGAWETLDLQGRFVMPGFNAVSYTHLAPRRWPPPTPS